MRPHAHPHAGAPPTWARRTGPQPSLHDRCVALWGEEYDPAAVRLVRRKLLKFDENQRPAYYGSWSTKRWGFKGGGAYG